MAEPRASRAGGVLGGLRWLVRAETLPPEPLPESAVQAQDRRPGLGGFARWLVGSDSLPEAPKAAEGVRRKSAISWLVSSEELPPPPPPRKNETGSGPATRK